MRKTALRNAVGYTSDRISAVDISINNFISTDNILPNKAGVTIANYEPAGTMPSYSSGDILVANIRPYLKKIWFATHAGGCSADVLVFKVKEGYDPKFIYYALLRDDFFAHAMKGAKGTKMPRGDKNQILEFLIPDFDFETQQKIAAVLSSLDSKIELNNRINAELEAMAKTLYDYWFVQFNFPDANGKPYKSSGGKMIWNEDMKREIPEVWIVKEIGNLCEVIDCLHSKKPNYYEFGNKFLLQLENIIDDGTIDISKKYLVTDEDYDTWTTRIEVREGDLVITNAGRVGAVAQIPNGLVTGIGRNITAIRSKLTHPVFLFYYFGSIDVKRQISQNTDVGAFFKSLNVRGIKLLKVISPPDDIVTIFEQKVKPIRTLIENNIKENQQLTELREWLLPMLMNGQVTVAEAEEKVAMAAEPEVAFGKQGDFGF